MNMTRYLSLASNAEHLAKIFPKEEHLQDERKRFQRLLKTFAQLNLI